jgi:hypothetical protein
MRGLKFRCAHVMKLLFQPLESLPCALVLAALLLVQLNLEGHGGASQLECGVPSNDRRAGVLS